MRSTYRFEVVTEHRLRANIVNVYNVLLHLPPLEKKFFFILFFYFDSEADDARLAHKKMRNISATHFSSPIVVARLTLV